MSSMEPIAKTRIQKSEKRTPPFRSSSDLQSRNSDGAWGRWLLGAFRIFNVRLRFFLILLALFLVVGKWEMLWNYWEKLSRNTFGHKPSEHAVSSEIEFWCPMCPGVASDWPAKCPVCNMALVQRTKHEMVPLPDGVISRMQLSPYRIQLAGIQTSTITYQPLVQEAISGGFVNEEGTVTAELFDRSLAYIREGQPIVGYCDALPGQGFCQGRVQSVDAQWVGGRWKYRMRLVMNNPNGDLKPGMFFTVHIRVPPSQWDWHKRLLMENWRDAMAADLVVHGLFSPAGLTPGAGLESLGRTTLQQMMLHQNLVPAIPGSAIVDTGRQKVAFVESGPGIFDALEVVVGPKCGFSYPLIRGLEPGQKVVTTGAFLIDAETRMNPAASSLYFGSGVTPQESVPASSGSRQASTPGGPRASSTTSADEKEIRSARLLLSLEDQRLVEAQEFCPINDRSRLGSMGKPFKIFIENKPVFLCCDGCQEKAVANPTETLAKVEHLKNQMRNKTQGK